MRQLESANAISVSMDARPDTLPGLGSRVPGLSIAVVGPDGLRWAGGVGLADLATRTPATPHTVYPWFSMTKLVTATAVLQLCERGRLALDAPVARYYAPFGALRPAPWTAGVTVRHLLSHSAGLPNPLPLRWVHPADRPGPEPGVFVAGLLARHPRLRSAPGARGAYSNLGYLILGELIAAVAGQPYEDYVREHILVPLGMARTDFRYTDALAATAATGYQRRWSAMTPLLRALLPPGILGVPTGRFVTFRRFYVDGAAYGGLIGPVDDAARFLRAHLGAGHAREGGLLTPASVALMQRLAVRGAQRDFGLGWFRPRARRADPPPFIEHLGGGAGFWNDMRLYPALGLGTVVMGNATAYDHEAIGQRLLARWGGHAGVPAAAATRGGVA